MVSRQFKDLDKEGFLIIYKGYVRPHLEYAIIQGSAIGPASYVVHASDLVSITACNSLCKYADDTYVIIPASNHLSRCAELDNIQTWANHNNLHLNRAKCV